MLLANRGYNNLFDEMFNDPFFTRPFGNSTSQIMKSDVREKDGKYLVDVELPGYSKDEVKADLKDGYLTITADKTEDKEDDDKHGKCIRKERYTGSCNRSFYVGDNVNEADIKASFKDGVLSLEIPKGNEKIEDKAKQIAIE